MKRRMGGRTEGRRDGGTDGGTSGPRNVNHIARIRVAVSQFAFLCFDDHPSPAQGARKDGRTRKDGQRAAPSPRPESSLSSLAHPIRRERERERERERPYFPPSLPRGFWPVISDFPPRCKSPTACLHCSVVVGGDVAAVAIRTRECGQKTRRMRNGASTEDDASVHFIDE